MSTELQSISKRRVRIRRQMSQNKGVSDAVDAAHTAGYEKGYAKGLDIGIGVGRAQEQHQSAAMTNSQSRRHPARQHAPVGELNRGHAFSYRHQFMIENNLPRHVYRLRVEIVRVGVGESFNGLETFRDMTIDMPYEVIEDTDSSMERLLDTLAPHLRHWVMYTDTEAFLYDLSIFLVSIGLPTLSRVSGRPGRPDTSPLDVNDTQRQAVTETLSRAIGYERIQ